MRQVLRCLSLFISLFAMSRAQENECGEPGKPFDGEIFGEKGETAKYSCKATDYLWGNGNRTCGSDGKWTGSVPVCLRSERVQGKLINWKFSNISTPRQTYHLSGWNMFDNKLRTCGSAFFNDTDRLKISINLTSNDLLEAVRVVFPLQNNNEFTLQTESIDSNATECIKSNSGLFDQGMKYQVTFDCSSNNGIANRLCLFFNKTSDLRKICEIYIFNQPVDGKCGTPDSPLNGKIVHSNDGYFAFQCYGGYYRKGSALTTCAGNGTWTHETPACLKRDEESHSMPEETKRRLLGDKTHELHGEGNNSLYEEMDRMLHGKRNESFSEEFNTYWPFFVYGTVTGALAIIFIGGIVIYLNRLRRKRSKSPNYRQRPSQVSQISSGPPSRERVCSVRYGSGYGDEVYSELEGRPQSNIPDILGQDKGLNLGTLGDANVPKSRPSSAIGHIYAVSTYDKLEYDTSKNQDRLRKSDNVMVENDYYSSDA